MLTNNPDDIQQRRRSRRALLGLAASATVGAGALALTSPLAASARTTIVQGATGPTGPAGPRGATGATGARGATGASGVAGAVGATGATGAAGAAAVEIFYHQPTDANVEYVSSTVPNTSVYYGEKGWTIRLPAGSFPANRPIKVRELVRREASTDLSYFDVGTSDAQGALQHNYADLIGEVSISYAPLYDAIVTSG